MGLIYKIFEPEDKPIKIIDDDTKVMSDKYNNLVITIDKKKKEEKNG